jgi:hypothetical protein
MRRPSPRSHKQDRGRQKSRQAAEWTAEPEENAHVGLLAVPGMWPTAEKTILTTLPPCPRWDLRWTPVHPSLHCATFIGPPYLGAAAQLSSVELCGRPWWSVHRGPCPMLVHELWTESTVIFYWKINSKINYPEKFAKRPLSFFVIKPQPTKILRRPLVFEIFPKMPLATFQKFQIGPYNFFSIYLCNRNSDFGDSCAKILRITLFYLMHLLTHVYCILIDFMYISR